MLHEIHIFGVWLIYQILISAMHDYAFMATEYTQFIAYLVWSLGQSVDLFHGTGGPLIDMFPTTTTKVLQNSTVRNYT